MADTVCDENNITELLSAGAWMAILEDCIKRNRLNITIFFASWSARATALLDTAVQLSKSHPEVTFCKVSTETCEDISKRMCVRTVPTTLIMWNGKEVERLKSTISSDVLEQKILLHSQNRTSDPSH